MECTIELQKISLEDRKKIAQKMTKKLDDLLTSEGFNDAENKITTILVDNRIDIFVPRISIKRV